MATQVEALKPAYNRHNLRRLWATEYPADHQSKHLWKPSPAVFLNPISEGAPSFIQAVADSSDGGTYLLGNYLLIIADCDRRIMLHFHVSSPKARKQACAKIESVGPSGK